jgi:hypothetical protein
VPCKNRYIASVEPHTNVPDFGFLQASPGRSTFDFTPSSYELQGTIVPDLHARMVRTR